ncbi:MAG: hypothetical protein WCO10_01930 [bacterium]
MKIEFCLGCSPEKMCERCQLRLRCHERVNRLAIGDLDRAIVELVQIHPLDMEQKTELRYLFRRYRSVHNRMHVAEISWRFSKLLKQVAAPPIGA